MGYPMTYPRFVSRNTLGGDYVAASEWEKTEPHQNLRRLLAGDLRRLEKDTRDPGHLLGYAKLSGASVEQVKAIFDAFFDKTEGVQCWHPELQKAEA